MKLQHIRWHRRRVFVLSCHSYFLVFRQYSRFTLSVSSSVKRDVFSSVISVYIRPGDYTEGTNPIWPINVGYRTIVSHLNSRLHCSCLPLPLCCDLTPPQGNKSDL